MLDSIGERDWKVFRELQAGALERFCERVLVEMGEAAAKDGTSWHERYLAVSKLMRERDRELADVFGGFSRSRAFLQLVMLRREGLIKEQEMGRFSEELRGRVGELLGTARQW